MIISKLDPDKYEDQIPKVLYSTYTKKEIWSEDTIIPMNLFKDQEKATEVIKNFMTNGGKYFSTFSCDYQRFIIHKDETSEKVIKQIIAEKKGEQVRSEED